MTSKDSSVVFGGGRMGGYWLDTLAKGFDSVTLVDKNSKQAEQVTKSGAHFLTMDLFTEGSESSATLDRKYRAALMDADLWVSALPPELHISLLEQALSADMDAVLVENPILPGVLNCSDGFPQRIENADTTVAVNYTELSDPVMLAIYRDALKTGFRPTRGFHWRGKDLRNAENDRYIGLPVTQDSHVHDIAQIEGLNRILYDSHPEFTVESVEWMKLWEDVLYQATRPFSAETDINSKFTVKVNNAHYTIRGGYDEHERRYFLWIDGNHDLAYFGNTLDRSHINPCAYRISGQAEIAKVEEIVTNGDIRTFTDVTDIMEAVDATEFNILPDYRRSDPLSRMLNLTLSSGSPPASFTDALRIERVVQDVYEEAGHPQANTY